MKNTVILKLMAAVMAACSLSACNHEEYDVYEPENQETPEMSNPHAVTITAGIDGGTDTKIALGDDTGSTTKVLWSKEDSFVLVDGSSKYVFKRSDESDAEVSSAPFTYDGGNGALPEMSKDGLKFVYPVVVPSGYASQSGTEDGLSEFMGMEAAVPAEASDWNGLSLNFNHTTAVVKMVLTHEAFRDAKVTVKLYAEGLLSNGNVITANGLQGDSEGVVTAYMVVPVTGNALEGCTIYVKTADKVYETSLGGNVMQAGKMYKVTKSDLSESVRELACHLPDGDTFNSYIRSVLDADPSLVKMKFIAGSDATGTPIGECGAYMVVNGDCLEIHTAALEFNFSSDCSEMFSFLNPDIISIEFSKNITTSDVISMRYMFGACRSLVYLDLSGFDTSNVTDMSAMFGDCNSLVSLDLSGFDTSNVTHIASMFSNCRSLAHLSLESFDVSHVTDLGFLNMFYGCSSLESLDLSSFDTSKITNMSGMFSGCSSLTTLDLSGFTTTNVTDMYQMFEKCSSLTILDVSGFDTSNVTDMSTMFWGCSNLTTLDLRRFDFDNVEKCEGMFYALAYSVTDKPIEVWVSAAGYDYLINENTGIDENYARLVRESASSVSAFENSVWN